MRAFRLDIQVGRVTDTHPQASLESCSLSSYVRTPRTCMGSTQVGTQQRTFIKTIPLLWPNTGVSSGVRNSVDPRPIRTQKCSTRGSLSTPCWNTSIAMGWSTGSDSRIISDGYSSSGCSCSSSKIPAVLKHDGLDAGSRR